MPLASHFPVLLVVVSLLGAYLAPWIWRWRRGVGRWWAVLISACALAQAVAILARVGREGVIRYHVGGWAPPFGIEIAIGPTQALMAVLLSAMAVLIAIYATESLPHEVNDRAIGWYNAAYLLVLAGMLGLTVTNDLFNVFVMMEITTLGAVGLVVAKDSWGAAEAGLRYLLLASLGSTLILFGIGLAYMLTGHLNMGFLTAQLAVVWTASPRLAMLSLSLITIGFALKAALFPLHVWLPEAHSNAPSPSSAVLSGLVVKAYAFALIRMGYVVFAPLYAVAAPVRAALITAGLAAIVAGSIFALVQVEVKRVLAYGTVAQLGYIFLGVGLGTPSALIAAFYQIINHAITKGCLFLCAGIIIEKTGRRRVSEMGGLGRILPLTTGAFTLCAMSMVGLPLLSGFVVKWYLIQGGFEAGHPVFVPIILISGLLNAAYYLPIVWRFYFQPSIGALPQPHCAFDPDAWPRPGPLKRLLANLEVPLPLLAPVLVLAAACVTLGIWTSPLVGYLGGVAGRLLGGIGP